MSTRHYWIEVVAEGQHYWSTWQMNGYKVVGLPYELHAITDEESDFLRETYERAEAEKKAQQFLELANVSDVHLVQVFQKSPEELGCWRPLWDADRERLGLS